MHCATAIAIFGQRPFRAHFSQFNRENYLHAFEFFVSALLLSSAPWNGARGRATAIEALRTNRGSLEMRGIIAAFIADETGATAIEYGLIAAGISIAIIVAVNNLGSTLNTTFTGVNTQLR
jgi:pilus assembly protein Flp/PilA